MAKAITIGREELLRRLSEVSPGLSPREIVEQSSCVVFKDGMLCTFNEEVACRAPSGLPKTLQGAVQATPLITQLQKWPEESIEIQQHEGEMVIIGKKRRAGIRMEAEVLLPIEAVDTPGKWLKMHEDFTDAVSIVQECASKDEKNFARTCIHIHPKYLEACDNYQLTRYRLKTGVKEPILVRRDALKHLPSLDLNEMSETESWLHFKGPSGLIISCLKYTEQYEDLSSILKVNGTPTVLPKALGEAVDKAEVFSSENSDNNLVTIELRPGKMRIRGQGVSGWYAEVKKLKYAGKAMKFMVPPKLMVELVKRHTECEISQDKLKVNGGRFTYVASLDSAENGHGEGTKTGGKSKAKADE